MGIEIVTLITVGSSAIFLLLTLADLHDWHFERPDGVDRPPTGAIRPDGMAC